MSEDFQEQKVEEKIHLRVAGTGPSYAPSIDPVPDLLSAHPHDAVKQLKELPTDEFLHLLEQSSPEQIQSFLQALNPSQRPMFQALPKLFGALLAVPEEPRASFSIIAWWESRRILFNTIVGLCGLPTFFILLFSGAQESFVISGTIEYAILANVCYTAGWFAELLARSWWKERARHLGPILFSLGFAFSIFITLAASLLVLFLFVLLRLLPFPAPF